MTAGRSFGPLRYRADLRTLMLLFALNTLFALEWLHIARPWYLLPPTYILAVVALVAKHNHVHSPTFRGPRWNSGFELWLSLLTAHPTSGIITSHNVLHHGNNNTEQDFVRCSLVRYRHNVLNLVTFFFVSVAEMYRNKPSDLDEWRNSCPCLYRQAVIERILTYSFLGLLVFVDWRSTLRYCAGPWLFAQWVLVTINLLQHQDCDFDSEVDHSRNLSGTIVNWLLLNNGYHSAHHLFPSAHWSLLPVIHKRVVAPRIHPSLNERSLWLCVWRRFIVGKPWQGARA
jgi:fatty acid desaturase